MRYLLIRSALAAAALSAYSASAASVAAQPTAPADSVIPGAALREDVRVLRAALEAVHPGLYRYTTPAELDRRFAALEARVANGATLADAYLAIAELVSTIACGHTFPNPANQARRVAGALFERTPRVPFYFRWIGGRMVVTRDASARGDFPPGAEILAINGVPAATILARLLPYSRTDGSNRAKRLANLGVLPEARWDAFDVYFPLVFPPPAGAWRFRVRAPDGRVRDVAAAPATAAQRLALRDSLTRASRDSAQPPWTLRVDSGGVATLVMPTWVTFNDSWDWTGWLTRAFAELEARRARALVIDLRGNEGGTSVGDAILAHLVAGPVTLRQFARYTRYRRVPDSLRPMLDTWDRSFDDWGDAAAPAAARPGFFRLVRDADDSTDRTIRPAGPRFAGRVFVLVGADNSSATFEFALAMRDLHLGTLVGQPTGGNQRGINGGAFYFLRLPRSGIEVDLPIIGFYADAPRPDAGIAPDIPVQPTARDVALGRDPEMAAVRRALGAR